MSEKTVWVVSRSEHGHHRAGAFWPHKWTKVTVRAGLEGVQERPANPPEPLTMADGSPLFAKGPKGSFVFDANGNAVTVKHTDRMIGESALAELLHDAHGLLVVSALPNPPTQNGQPWLNGVPVKAVEELDLGEAPDVPGRGDGDARAAEQAARAAAIAQNDKRSRPAVHQGR